ncbi:MAG: Rid family hydrolase [Methanoculleus sp.]|uniref:RidA family protein n=1 Tax=unclassified Methanoculleus TaxID=2619537 RepID=UPI0025E8FA95|nr:MULTISPECIES: Rid family hydrolase [unclassified Methanoculleus]MCK9317523.1 Rid family hydrolase [Methanoculleus sp.]MDD2253841.1 Rid family hydrolase [Methanoculleus sp.]MDD2787648.1 Rid family hydrolase [Methanoculleus sp.]MDD3217165.1 Rid family hydrolase [Methanoculleus sp.]MDD4313798.1 Rid family hydrolase [Methanoculleus sp.]
MPGSRSRCRRGSSGSDRGKLLFYRFPAQPLPVPPGRPTGLSTALPRAVLLKAGLDISDVVQTRIYLTDLADFETVNAVYAEYFVEPYPARARVEIEMVAKAR